VITDVSGYGSDCRTSSKTIFISSPKQARTSRLLSAFFLLTTLLIVAYENIIIKENRFLKHKQKKKSGVPLSCVHQFSND